MDRLRILIITSSLKVGGAAHHVLNLSRFCAANGHESAVCALAPEEEGLETVLVAEGVPLYRIPLRSLRFLASPRVVMGMRRMMADFKPHILHAHLFHAEAAVSLASFLTRAPVVVTRHSAGLEYRGWRAAVSRATARRFAACIAVSGEAAEEARGNGWSPDKVTVLPNAVDPGRFRPLEGSDREKRRAALVRDIFGTAAPENLILVGSAGGLKRVKNFPLMARVAARLAGERGFPDRDPGIRFVIAGEACEGQSLLHLVRDLGISSLFALPGRREDLQDFFPLLDIFMLPSFTEGLPLALLEAMSSGVACVASDVGGIGEVLSGAGLLADPGDEDGFARSVKQLMHNDDARVELGRKARVRVLERYNLDIWGEKILEVYRSALGGVAAR